MNLNFDHTTRSMFRKVYYRVFLVIQYMYKNKFGMLRENYRHKRLSGFTIMHLFGPKLKVLIFLRAAKK